MLSLGSVPLMGRVLRGASLNTFVCPLVPSAYRLGLYFERSFWPPCGFAGLYIAMIVTSECLHAILAPPSLPVIENSVCTFYSTPCAGTLSFIPGFVCHTISWSAWPCFPIPCCTLQMGPQRKVVGAPTLVQSFVVVQSKKSNVGRVLEVVTHVLQPSFSRGSRRIFRNNSD